jgi:hypothetical protein
MQPQDDSTDVAVAMRAFFARNGCIRGQDPERKAAKDGVRYKKCDEIRLTAYSEAELAYIRELLHVAGFRIGNPYKHHEHQYRQPVYGRGQVARFLDLIGSPRVEVEVGEARAASESRPPHPDRS